MRAKSVVEEKNATHVSEINITTMNTRSQAFVVCSSDIHPQHCS
jgi:hypothetical protein